MFHVHVKWDATRHSLYHNATPTLTLDPTPHSHAAPSGPLPLLAYVHAFAHLLLRLRDFLALVAVAAQFPLFYPTNTNTHAARCMLQRERQPSGFLPKS